MSKDEEFVRSVWKRVVNGPYNGLNSHHFVAIDKKKFVDFNPNSRDSWTAAAEFTRERLKQIAEVDEEIGLLVDELRLHRRSCHSANDNACDYARPLKRTLARLESALAGLKQGMRTAGSNGARSDAND